MFQDFSVLSSPETGRERVKRLRATFDSLGVDAVLIPRADAFQGEYVPASEARLAWISGFTGSAGIALVTREEALVFIDGRYTTQARAQTDKDTYQTVDLVEVPPSTWIRSYSKAALRIGFDPWLHTMKEVRDLEKAVASTRATLVPLKANPVDAIWDNRPAEPTGKVTIHPRQHAGVLASEKLAAIQQQIGRENADVFVMTDPTSVAWAFNIRGADLPHNPHPLARAIVPANAKPRLFIADAKLGIEEKAYLTQLCELEEPDTFEDALRALGKAGQTVMLDPALTPQKIAMLTAEDGGVAGTVEAADPARRARAIKNATELAGAQHAHKVDGVAMVTFLAWLDDQPPGSVDEIAAAKNLEAVRIANGKKHDLALKDISFETIAGSGPHAALPHYRVNKETNRRPKDGELFLIDSGGQYVAGTTDITRTVAIGQPNAEMRRFFTLVLKGMIAISLARFPAGTRGSDIDVLARIALWKAGADYAHGTGHGVGSYLCVHEGPQSISRRGHEVLEPGMIVSNEPGYYREGAFGIRIENLVAVHAARAIEGGDKPMLGFDTLTLCPIDRRLMEPALLSEEERDWLNAYHARVNDELSPLIDDVVVLDWLKRATVPV